MLGVNSPNLNSEIQYYKINRSISIQYTSGIKLVYKADSTLNKQLVNASSLLMGFDYNDNK